MLTEKTKIEQKNVDLKNHNHRKRVKEKTENNKEKTATNMVTY